MEAPNYIVLGLDCGMGDQAIERKKKVMKLIQEALDELEMETDLLISQVDGGEFGIEEDGSITLIDKETNFYIISDSL